MSRFPRQGDPALGKFIRYMEETALNVRYNYLNRLGWLHSKENLAADIPELIDMPSLEPAPTALENITGNDTLHTAIVNLSDIEKKVLLLSIIEERPMAEVEGLLHISFGHAYRLRRRALAKLRVALEKKGDQYD